MNNDGTEIYNIWKNAKKESIKWYSYFSKYEEHFSPLRDKEINFLEIGIRGGGSLEMWREYFPKAKIIGLEISHGGKQFEDEDNNIFVEIGSQDSTTVLEKLIKKFKKFDIILDDGGHTSKLHKTSFSHLFPHLNEGGVYCIEDLHTVFMEEFYANEDENLFQKLLSDVSFNNDSTKAFLPDVSMHFYRSIAFIKKIKPEPIHHFGMQININDPAEF